MQHNVLFLTKSVGISIWSLPVIALWRAAGLVLFICEWSFDCEKYPDHRQVSIDLGRLWLFRDRDEFVLDRADAPHR